MHVLITNHELGSRGGTSLYTCELAVSLHKLGIEVSVYSPILGPLATGLSNAGVSVYDDLAEMDGAPDIIHGHHHVQTMQAILRFPATRAIFVCHGVVPWQEMPFLHPNIVQYYAVSNMTAHRVWSCTKRLGAPVKLSHNWVDTDRFQAKPFIKKKPKSALIITNYTYDTTQIEKACRQQGISVRKIGSGFGNVSDALEAEFIKADLVFGLGRTAIEAMAVGCAVILSSADGVAGLITKDNFSAYRDSNFALEFLRSENMNVDFIMDQIKNIDPDDVSDVRTLIRNSQSLDLSCKNWLAQYRYHLSKDFSPSADHAFISNYISQLEFLLKEQESRLFMAEQKRNLYKIEQRTNLSKIAALERPGFRKLVRIILCKFRKSFRLRPG